MPVKLLVDPSVFRYGRCGLTRYYGALCQGLRDQHIEVSLPLVSSSCDVKFGLSRYTTALRRVPKAAATMDAVSMKLFHRGVRGGDYDWILVTSPSFDASFLEHNPEARFIMVVHDLMTCVTAPDGLYDAAGPGLSGLLYLASRAALVICISHDTHRALLRHGVVNPERVVVVHTGNLLAAANPVEKSVPLPNRFFLFVGERSGRKGFFSVIQALQEIMRTYGDLYLVCTGRLNSAERDYLYRYGILDRVQDIVADDGTLVHLYRNAICLLYPSLYEGFGLPVVEAMHYGCPVITTNRGALPEITGDAAIVLDAVNPEAIKFAIQRVLADPDSMKELVECGKVQAAKFKTMQMMTAIRQYLTILTASQDLS